MDYDSYQGVNKTITLSNPLCSIGDIKDEIICKDGVWGILKKLWYESIDGTNIELNTQNSCNRFACVLAKGTKSKISDTTSGVTSLNSMFQPTYSGGTWTQSNCYNIYTNGYIYFVKDGTLTLSEMQVILNTTPMEVVYELVTPI